MAVIIFALTTLSDTSNFPR